MFMRSLQETRRGTILGAVVAAISLPPALAQDGVSPATSKAVVRRLIEGVQRDGDFELFERLFAADYVDHTPFGRFPPNRDGTRAIYQTFRRAFPDWRATIHRQIAEDDVVTSHKTYFGTHLGPFLDLPPTGRATHFQVIDIMRVRGGQITDHWGFGDAEGLLRQLRA